VKLTPISADMKSRILDNYDRADALNAVIEYAASEVMRERERCAALCEKEAREAWETYENMDGAGGNEYTEAEASSETADLLARYIRGTAIVRPHQGEKQ
jgi:hypothetical protein